MPAPTRPPLDGLKRQLDRARTERRKRPADGFVRETFLLPRSDARLKAQEWFDWTAIESWFERPNDMIEFTIRRLSAAD